MKSKILFLSTLTLGLAAVVAGGMAPRQASRASAYNDEDGYVATNDHVVFSTHRNNALRNAYNGDDNEGDSTRANNVTIEGLDPTSTVAWKVSTAKYAYDKFRNLKLGNKQSTIKNSEDENFADIFTTIGVGDDHFVSALYSTTRISNITDISLTWGAVSGNIHEGVAGDFYLLYKLEGGSWTKIGRESKGTVKYYLDGFYGTDDANRTTNNIWNQRIGYYSEAVIESNPDLYGHDAQIAIAYDAGTNSSANNFVCMHTLMINRVNSIKAQMHYWDKLGADVELCTYITDAYSNNNHKLGMFAYRLTSDHVSALDVAANFEYHNAKEPTYYSELYYLCSEAGYTGLPAVPQAFFKGLFADNNSITSTVMLVSSLTVITIGFGAYFILRKKRA